MQNIDSRIVRKKALAAYKEVKSHSPALLGTRLNYAKLKQGYLEFLRLRPFISPEPLAASYRSLAGQQMAQTLEEATLDDVLSVIIEPHPAGGWRYDVILTNCAMGSPEHMPLPTREDAERGALRFLGSIGTKLTPHKDFKPVEDAEDVLAIRLNGKLLYVKRFNTEKSMNKILKELKKVGVDYSPDDVCAALALRALKEDIGDSDRVICLGFLANRGWMHVTEELVEQFCLANGVDIDDVRAGPFLDAAMEWGASAVN